MQYIKYYLIIYILFTIYKLLIIYKTNFNFPLNGIRRILPIYLSLMIICELKKKQMPAINRNTLFIFCMTFYIYFYIARKKLLLLLKYKVFAVVIYIVINTKKRIRVMSFRNIKFKKIIFVFYLIF